MDRLRYALAKLSRSVLYVSGYALHYSLACKVVVAGKPSNALFDRPCDRVKGSFGSRLRSPSKGLACCALYIVVFGIVLRLLGAFSTSNVIPAPIPIPAKIHGKALMSVTSYHRMQSRAARTLMWSRQENLK